LLIFALFFIGFIVLRKYEKMPATVGKVYAYISFPYLHEEIRLFLNTYFRPRLIEVTRIGSYRFVNSPYFKCFCIFIYLSPKITSLISIGIFINFTFFQGDLRLMLFGLPLSFITFLSSFYIFWLERFIADNLETCRRSLIISSKTFIDEKSPCIHKLECGIHVYKLRI
jgi:hypothetical protein